VSVEKPEHKSDKSQLSVNSSAFDKNSQRMKKKLALLNEARRMISQRGEASISLDDLASNLDISKGTVYYYFKNKDELLFECYRISFDIWEHALESAEGAQANGAQKLEIFLRSYLTEGLGTLHIVIYLRDQSSLHEPYRSLAERRRKALRDRMRAFIEEGRADGSLEGTNPKISATILGAAITWLLRAYQLNSSQSKAAYIDDAVSVLLNGFRKRNSTQ